MKAYIMLRTTFGVGVKAKEIKIKYLVIDAPSSYIMIIWRLTFNHLGAALSILYLCMKYTLSDGKIGFI